MEYTARHRTASFQFNCQTLPIDATSRSMYYSRPVLEGQGTAREILMCLALCEAPHRIRSGTTARYVQARHSIAINSCQVKAGAEKSVTVCSPPTDTRKRSARTQTT